MTTSANTRYQLALENAMADFNDGDPVRAAILKLAAFLQENRNGNLSHLSYGMLRKAAHLAAEDGSILHRTLAYLTGEANLLCMYFEYLVDDFEHELDDSETDAFVADGEFFDPRTGVLVDNSDSHIFVFFRPNYSVFH